MWAAYIVLPVEAWGLFTGRPLGLLATTTLAVVCWLAFARRTALPWLAILTVLVLKATVGTIASVPRGFAARYYANANFAGPAERIELVHRAEDRMIFARGALHAASWARGKKPGLYSMADVLGLADV